MSTISQNSQRSENEISDSNISVTEILSPIARGGGGREDGLQDDGNFGACVGEKGGSLRLGALPKAPGCCGAAGC